MSMIPKSLKYGNKAEASMARSYTSNIQPNGALNDYRQGSVTTFMIPTGPNLALVSPESVLKFKVTTLGADDGRLDSAGAHGYIQRIRIWHGSNQIEDTDNYGLLAKNISIYRLVLMHLMENIAFLQVLEMMKLQECLMLLLSLR